MFFAKTNDFRSSSLNISILTNREDAKGPAAFVWFENERRKLEEDLYGEPAQIKNHPCSKSYQFVWFDGTDIDPKERIEALPKENIESELDENFRKVFELNSNMVI